MCALRPLGLKPDERSTPRRSSLPRKAGDELSKRLGSQQVTWFEVNLFVESRLDGIEDRPLLGTPEWCSLSDNDPRKGAAVLEAGVLWALRLDTEQEHRAEASRDIAGAADWSAIGRSVAQREAFYADRPWLKRRSA
jgi:hypothetical protein